MASSNIKLFDENKGNMLTDTEFNISTQRLNGLQTGVASSQLQNKAMYQASLMAYAIAQVMLQNGKNANDTDAVSAFVANLSGTMLQKVYDLATTAEAQAGVATGKWMSPALVKAAIDSLAAKAQNILSDATKGLYGLPVTAVPDDVLALIKTLIDNGDASANANANSKATIITGSYAGTSSYTNSITFPVLPKFVYITGPSGGWKNAFITVVNGMASYTYEAGNTAFTTTPTISGTTISWQASSTQFYAMNYTGNYQWIAIY